MTDVLFMYYGTPYSEDEILPYYTDIRHGHPPPPPLLEELKARYRHIGKSPLNEITHALARRLEALLRLSHPYFPEGLPTPPPPREDTGPRVFVGTKHSQPTIQDAVVAMAEAGVRRAVGLVAAPHYSARSIAEYEERAREALERLGHPFAFKMIPSYAEHPAYLKAQAERVLEGLWRLKEPKRAAVLFSAHSVPLRSVEKDGGVYPKQLEATARGIARLLGIESYRLVYQSAGRTEEAWLGPDVNEVIEALAKEGFQEVLVAAIGFPADHLEVYYDLDYEAMQTAERVGIRLVRAPSLNAGLDYARALAAIVEEAVLTWSTSSS